MKLLEGQRTSRLPVVLLLCHTSFMTHTPNQHNDDDYIRAGGPYTDMIRALVESGRFGSAAEVVLEGLALVRERELTRKATDDWMRAEVQKGIGEADRGELISMEEVFERLRAKYGAMAEDKTRMIVRLTQKAESDIEAIGDRIAERSRLVDV